MHLRNIFEKGMQNEKIDLIKDDLTAKLYEELIGSKWEIEVMGENPHFGHLILGEDQLPNLERKCRLCKKALLSIWLC